MDVQHDFKKIHDNIWGDIRFSNIADRFLSSPFFFALKNKKQLGVCSFVFSGANHTRFEHSVGVYHLCHRLLDKIKERVYERVVEGGRIILETKTGIQEYLSKISSLDSHFKEHNSGYYHMDDKLCEMIAIAGLCHDLGHGPFSHLFDDLITSKLTTPNRIHEYRSAMILEHIIQSDPDLNQYFDTGNIEFMKLIINPNHDCTGFIFQIVCNELNGLDVDKFDYLKRDTYNLGLPYSCDISNLLEEIDIIDNNICYSTKCYRIIVDLFKLRHKLHTEIYSHPKVVAVHHMVGDILEEISKPLKIIDSVKDIRQFFTLQDDIIFQVMRLDEKTFRGKQHGSIENAKRILSNLMQHNIYKFVGSFDSGPRTPPTPASMVEKDSSLVPEDIVVHQIRFGYTSSIERDVFATVSFYDKKRNIVHLEGPVIIETPTRTNFYARDPSKERQVRAVVSEYISEQLTA